MNTKLLRARRTSLALIVTAVLSHGHLLPDYNGASPGTSGLTRLGRDLMRRASADRPAPVARGATTHH